MSPVEGGGLDTACQAIMSDTNVLAFHATGAFLRDCLLFVCQWGCFGLSVGQFPSLCLFSLSLYIFRTYCMQDVRHGTECHKGRCNCTPAAWTKPQNRMILKMFFLETFSQGKNYVKVLFATNLFENNLSMESGLVV